MSENIQLNQLAFNEDLRDYLEHVPDNFYDLAVIDPPQGNNQAHEIARRSGETCPQTQVKRGDYHYGDWDRERWSKDHFKQIFRVSKIQIVFCASFYTDFLDPGNSWISWRKLTGSSSFGDVELAWTSEKGAHREFTFKWNGFQQGVNIANGHIQKGDKSKNERTDPRFTKANKII